MRKFFLCTASLIILLTYFTSEPSIANHLGSVRQVLSYIESGSYDDAAALLEQSCPLDNSDSLGHKMLGIIYLHTGDLSRASEEFQQSLRSAPEDWHLYYALAIIALAQRRFADVKVHLEAADAYTAARPETSLVRSYLDHLSRRSPVIDSSISSDAPLAIQISAMEAVVAGDFEAALPALSSLVRGIPPRGFQEKRAPTASFDPKNPIQLPAGKLTWRPAGNGDVATVSGTITLKADVGGAGGVSFVTFYVDDEFVAATNNSPFQYNWNTLRHLNGIHEVRIEARDGFGAVVSRKTLRVRVLNPEANGRPRLDGEGLSEVSRRLWGCIRLAESRKLAHYHLAELYLTSGLKDQAVEHFQYAIAYQPDFRDASKRLNELRGRENRYAEIKEANSGRKRIAVTFDDGPNERTIETLELLAQLQVPATFFVVGFRAEAQPELMKAIISGGHQIENHTYTHRNLPSLLPQEIESELAKTGAIIRNMTGVDSLFFRPPGGHLSDSVRRAAARLGLTCVLWTVNCSPYEATSREALVSYVLSNACDGAIVLMHNGEPVTNSALPDIVRVLKANGYEFVTLSALLSSSD